MQKYLLNRVISHGSEVADILFSLFETKVMNNLLKKILEDVFVLCCLFTFLCSSSDVNGFC